MTAFLMQMAGGNGSGKSTLSRAVAVKRGAAVLDHDTSKSALLAAGIAHPPAGAASYETLFAFASDLLRQGLGVIIDSPSAYREVPERGLALAESIGIPYYFVECTCPVELADDRLASRTARPSQVAGPQQAAELRMDPSRTPHRPSSGWLLVETSSDLRGCTDKVIDYLESPGASGPVVAARA